MTERNDKQELTETVGKQRKFSFLAVKQVSGLSREEYSDYCPLIPGASNTLTARQPTGAAKPSLPGFQRSFSTA